MATPKAALTHPATAALAPNPVVMSTVRNERENAPSRFTARATTSSRTARGNRVPPRIRSHLTLVTDESAIVGDA